VTSIAGKANTTTSGGPSVLNIVDWACSAIADDCSGRRNRGKAQPSEHVPAPWQTEKEARAGEGQESNEMKRRISPFLVPFSGQYVYSHRNSVDNDHRDDHSMDR